MPLTTVAIQVTAIAPSDIIAERVEPAGLCPPGGPRAARLCVALGAALALATLAGCATQPDCPPPLANRPLTPTQVAASGGHLGELQRWGGTLVEVRHGADQTELVVLAYPLERCGEPRTDSAAQGRFILVQDGFIETADRPNGSRLTASGLITGVRDDQVGAAANRLPVLQARSIHWWPEGADAGYQVRPRVGIGIGGGSGGMGGGIGVYF